MELVLQHVGRRDVREIADWVQNPKQEREDSEIEENATVVSPVGWIANLANLLT
jgi:hypothetical protein